MFLNKEELIKNWVLEDSFRMNALRAAQSLGLSNWCIAAGFVRNLVWDKIHNYSITTPLNDLDLIFFEKDLGKDSELELALKLNEIVQCPWSVKNQAHMHLRNIAKPYLSIEDAMSYWPEIETAIGVRLEENGALTLIAPFGVDTLFNFTITKNLKCLHQNIFEQRVIQKNWLSLWQRLNVKKTVR